jgi:hypothetical protein
MNNFGRINPEALEWAENPEWAEKYGGIDFRPPQSVADAAARGLELRKKTGRGGFSTKQAAAEGVGSGVQRAASLKNRQSLSPATIGRMVSFFARHSAYKKDHTTDPPSNSLISWLLWGGDPGRAWAEKVKAQMDRADEK